MAATNLSRSGALQTSDEDVPFLVADPRIRKYKALLSQENVDIGALSKLTWNGAIEEFRGVTWRLLLGYAPANTQRRNDALTRKRTEYRDLVNRYYASLETNELKSEWLATISTQEHALIHQIRIDVPRTLPHNPLFAQPAVQRALERILLMWALRHPASGYVQGINDLVTPFLVVFLREILNSKSAASSSETAGANANSASSSSAPSDAPSAPNTTSPTETSIDTNTSSKNTADDSNDGAATAPELGEEPSSPRSVNSEASCDSDASPRASHVAEAEEDSTRPRKFARQAEDLNIDLTHITTEEMALVEADSYWAVSKFIDCIQDNYTSSQPGIQRSLHRLSELVGKLDPALFNHLQTQGVMFVQFAFRWVNCLLMRELPLSLVIRLWDTYISEGDRFPTLHTYVCASFLLAFSKELVSSDFQTLMMFLHHLPTDDWNITTIEPLISQAFMWQAQYGDAAHII